MIQDKNTYLKSILIIFFQKIGNLKHFVTDIKSKLRDEFSALMMLADAEEEILGSQESGKVMLFVGLDFLGKPTIGKIHLPTFI